MSTAGPSIERRTAAEVVDGFHTLRAEGLRLLQELSRETWTDYNLHDPGVTVLEQLVYGLTDLLYRMAFEVEDHLTDPDGRLDYSRQALHLPSDIFPCRPTTPADLRRKVLADVPGIADVRFFPWGAPEIRDADLVGAPGLYVMMVRLARRPGNGASTRPRRPLMEAVRTYLRQRNLAEDIHPKVVTPTEVPFDLHGTISIEGDRPPAEIMADVYRTAADYVRGAPTPFSAARASREGRSLDQIFDGPARRAPREGSMEVGGGGRATSTLLDDDGYDERFIFIADIVARVKQVEGVRSVDHLHLEPASRWYAGVDRSPSPAMHETDRIRRVKIIPGEGRQQPEWLVPSLREPARGESAEWVRRVTLRRGASEVSVSETLGSLYERGKVVESMRADHESQGPFYSPPRGVHRSPGTYSSVQRHFPAVYGMNEAGVPPSANAGLRGRVAQLKAYVLLAEQFMANHCAQVEGLRALFSTDGPGWTYAHLVLGADEIPGYEALYGSKGPGPYLEPPERFLPGAMRDFDDVDGRRARLLDHLLAVYGEAPAERRPTDGEAAEDVRPIDRSTEETYLRSVVALTRDRVGADDYSREVGAWEEERGGDDGGGTPRAGDMSGFRRRLGLRLGLEDVADGPLLARSGSGGKDEGSDANGSVRGPSTPEAFHLVEHILLRPVHGWAQHHSRARKDVGISLDSDELWASFYPLRVTVLFPDWVGRFVDEGFRRHVEQILYEESPAHVHPTCRWLEHERMSEFETLFGAWRARHRTWCYERPPAGGRALDAASLRLIDFLTHRDDEHEGDGV